MLVRFIDKGTRFDVTLVTEDPALNRKFNATLHEVVDDTTLLIRSDDFYEYCADANYGFRISVYFTRISKGYAFNGEYDSTLIQRDKKLIKIRVVSMVEEASLRSLPRLELSLSAKLYVKTENGHQKLICEGQTMDINFNGICLLSNEKVNEPDDSKFYIEFTLFKYDRFNLPAKLVRRGNSPQFVQFKYDYAFLFDFSVEPAEKDRLINSLFKIRIEATKS